LYCKSSGQGYAEGYADADILRKTMIGGEGYAEGYVDADIVSKINVIGAWKVTDTNLKRAPVI